MPANRAIVTITREMKDCPHKYLGVVELVDRGFTTVEVVLSFGTQKFPNVPFMVTVDSDTTYCEFRNGKMPLLTVTEWQSMEHFYMY